MSISASIDPLSASYSRTPGAGKIVGKIDATNRLFSGVWWAGKDSKGYCAQKTGAHQRGGLPLPERRRPADPVLHAQLPRQRGRPQRRRQAGLELLLLHLLLSARRLGVALSSRCAALLAVLLALLASRCSDGDEARPTTQFTLTVMPKAPPSPDVRVRFSPATTPEQAERVQADLAGLRVRTQSVLPSPFRTLYIAIRGPEREAALARLGSALRDEPAVEGVDICPCPDEERTPHKTPVAPAQVKLHRSCAASPVPVPVAGCVTEFEMIGERPVGECSPHYVLVFDATAGQATAGSVQRLKGRVTAGAPAVMPQHVPFAGKEVLLKPGGRVPAEIRGYYLGTPAFKEEIEFSPGYLRTYVGLSSRPPRVFWVSTRPEPPTTLPVRIKGATKLCLTHPVAPGRFDRRYEVVVDVETR